MLYSRELAHSFHFWCFYFSDSQWLLKFYLLKLGNIFGFPEIPDFSGNRMEIHQIRVNFERIWLQKCPQLDSHWISSSCFDKICACHTKINTARRIINLSANKKFGALQMYSLWRRKRLEVRNSFSFRALARTNVHKFPSQPWICLTRIGPAVQGLRPVDVRMH